ncbi:hypothetical protein SFUMM280S_10935 [Streptomyces fumanus]
MAAARRWRAHGRRPPHWAAAQAAPRPRRANPNLTELASGLTELRDGPVGDAHQTLLLAASLLAGPAPAQAATAALAAATRPGPRATWKPVWPPSAPTGAATR